MNDRTEHSGVWPVVANKRNRKSCSSPTSGGAGKVDPMSGGARKSGGIDVHSMSINVKPTVRDDGILGLAFPPLALPGTVPVLDALASSTLLLHSPALTSVSILLIPLSSLKVWRNSPP